MLKKILFFFSITLSFMLSGCLSLETSPTYTPTQLSEAQDELEQCFKSNSLKQTYDACISDQRRISPLGQDAIQRAKDHWNDVIENGGPNYKLMAATFLEDITMLKDAIKEGADVNFIMPRGELHGIYDSDWRYENITPLSYAAEDLSIDIVRTLIDYGADVNWRDPDYPTRDVASDIYPGKLIIQGDTITYSWDPIYLLLVKGYSPSAATLMNWYQNYYRSRSAKPELEVEQAYLALKRKAKPEDFSIFQRILKNAEAEEQSIKEENKRQDAEFEKSREEARSKLNALLAEQNAMNIKRTQHMRYLGAKICQDVQTGIGRLISTGYVEKIAEHKVQIRVVHRYLHHAPTTTPGAFKTEIIWDQLNNWHSCE